MQLVEVYDPASRQYRRANLSGAQEWQARLTYNTLQRRWSTLLLLPSGEWLLYDPLLRQAPPPGRLMGPGYTLISQAQAARWFTENDCEPQASLRHLPEAQAYYVGILNGTDPSSPPSAGPAEELDPVAHATTLLHTTELTIPEIAQQIDVTVSTIYRSKKWFEFRVQAEKLGRLKPRGKRGRQGRLPSGTKSSGRIEADDYRESHPA